MEKEKNWEKERNMEQEKTKKIASSIVWGS
jgi:hypothetical protein